MKVKILLIGLFILSFSELVISQQRITIEEYIDMYKDLAMEEMLEHRIPASITLAQGILESNCGNSPLALEANNHFGIKCHKEWTGKTFIQDDEEKNECFRKYGKAEDSYRDHSDFLVTRDRYNLLFNLKADDYKGWAHGLKQAGYATNPKYPELLIKIIEENRLYIFDINNDQNYAAKKQTIDKETHHAKTPNQRPTTNDQRLSSGPPEIFELAGKGGNNRIIFRNNGVKFIYAREGDDFQLIASEFEIYSWQVYSYNDLKKEDKLVTGQKVYLEKKKKRGAYDYHLVKDGESLYTIAQDYGIRLQALCKLNGNEQTGKVGTGQKLSLK
jgi:LysM repeat protein